MKHPPDLFDLETFDLEAYIIAEIEYRLSRGHVRIAATYIKWLNDIRKP